MQEAGRLERGAVQQAQEAFQAFMVRSIRSLVMLLVVGVLVYNSHDWAAKEYAKQCLGISSLASMYCRCLLEVIKYGAGTFPEMVWKVFGDIFGNLKQYLIMYLD